VAVLALAFLAAPADAAATTIHVRPPHSIQAAIDDARPGDTVRVHPGVYREDGSPCPIDAERECGVVITRDRVRLVGAPRRGRPVVLERSGGQAIGISVGGSRAASCLDDPGERIDGAVVRGLTVRGFADVGVFLDCAVGWRVSRVRAVRNREYAFFPSHVGAGRIDHSFAGGAHDTGFYVGQSSGVRVTRNTARRNLSGFEIENSSGVRIDHNKGTANTAGLLSFTLPGLEVEANSDNRIDHNRFTANNRETPCSDPGDIVCQVPSGVGIVLVATDRNTVDSNMVIGNDTAGIGVASYCVVAGAPGCVNGPDQTPDGNRVVANSAHANGGDPGGGFEVFASDLGWDTTGTGNCWSGNDYDKSFPPALPAC
jgi:parallel beta-helix repeat protein